MKIHKKSVIYYANQDLIPVSDEKLEEMKIRLAELKVQKIEKQSNLKSLKKELQSLRIVKPTSFYREEKERIKQFFEVQGEKLGKVNDNEVIMISDSDFKVMNDKIEKYSKTLKKAKKIAKNMIETLMEGSEMNKKTLYSKIGIEDYKV